MPPGYPVVQGLTFFLVAVRLVSALMASPVSGSNVMPLQVRIGLGLLLAAALAPVVPVESVPATAGGYAAAVVRETLIGLLAGFTIHLVFLAIQFAAGLIGIQMGMSMPSGIDPILSQQEVVLGRFLLTLGTLIFVQMDGLHYIVLGANSLFVSLPVGGPALPALGAEKLVDFLAASFTTALRMAAPMVGILLLADVGLALLARTEPQLNLFVIGIPLKLGVGLFSLSLGLPSLTYQLASIFQRIPMDMAIWSR